MIDLKAIRSRADAAAPGPWKVSECDDCDRPDFVCDGRGHMLFDTHEAEIQDVTFAAHAREDVPALLDLVGELQRALSNLEADVRYFSPDPGCLQSHASALELLRGLR